MENIFKIKETMKRTRGSINRITVLDAIYKAEDWVTSDELRYLPVKYRTIQNQLKILTEMEFLIREEIKPSYRYKIDKTKDLTYYHECIEIFRMNKDEIENRYLNF